ncbi:hypothetical protein B5M09_010036 [Aphanomyces astaci]|uniref:PX domain-containing protein n=1 Tax=Aphanomyces astaci TaxID=112090 RepID=A0A425DF50_APHAT|nr:hypothetical protein B5M09_010036 [Aphanomyces astaci]
MTVGPEDIDASRPYTCEVNVDDVRILQKAEYEVSVKCTYFSESRRSKCTATWSVWRSFSAFRLLDAQLRKRSPKHMKGIKFPPLHRQRTLFRTHLEAAFLEARRAELDTYMSMVTSAPAFVTFHITSIEAQSLKSFVAYSSGFGQNVTHVPTSADAIGASRNSTFVERPRPQMTSQSLTANYRWSGTGFLGGQQLKTGNACLSMRHNSTNGGFVHVAPQQFNQSFKERQTFAQNSSESNSIKSNAASLSRQSVPPHAVLDGTDAAMSSSRLMAVTVPEVADPEVERERGKMELELRSAGLQGVGMPPDGSCLLHCLVYELFPLKWDCFKTYPAAMSMVNVGSADGIAPRRMQAAAQLRTDLAAFALANIDALGTFLMTSSEDLTNRASLRYTTFGNVPDEQATVAELYAAATMLDLEIVLVTNDPAFHIDPVVPVDGIPSIRGGGDTRRTIVLGYMPPTPKMGGHYLCTREISYSNSFASGYFAGKMSNPAPDRSEPMPCAEAACVSLLNDMEALKKQHEGLLHEKAQWEEDRMSMHRQVDLLSTQNAQLHMRLEDKVAAVLDASEVEDIRAKWADALRREQALSETLQRLEQDTHDAADQRRFNDITTELQLKEHKLRNAMLEIDTWKKEHANMRVALESLQLQVSSTPSSPTTDATTSALTQRIQRLEEDMRVQDKEILANARRDLKQKQMQIDTFLANYVHKDSWQPLDAQLTAATAEIERLRLQLDQLPALSPSPAIPPITIATPNVSSQSKGEVLASPPSNASKKAAVVLLDSQKELESQFQMGLELDQCLEECATLYFENHQLTDKITTIEAALAMQSEWQQNAADMTRKLALFEVNQARLARQFNLVLDEKQTEYTRRIALEDELLDVERTLKTRLQYLEAWKIGATQRMHAMQKALHESILKVHFDDLQDAYTTLQETYAAHLDRWNARHAEYVQALDLKEQNAKLVDKHKAIAALAASQANTLAARQSRRRDEVATLEERLRELASRSDDDAIIGQLQQKLMTIQANYHSFTDRYEKAMELQRAAQLQVNTLTLQMDATSQHLASELEKERQTNRVLESTIATLKQSDLRGKLKRLEAMATRIEALEDDAVQLHAKKRALERRVEELEAGVSTPSTGPDLHEVQRYKHRIAILEQKERYSP